MQLRPEFFPARLHHADRDFSARGVTDCACNVVLKVRHMRQQIPAGGENKGREKKVRSDQTVSTTMPRMRGCLNQALRRKGSSFPIDGIGVASVCAGPQKSEEDGLRAVKSAAKPVPCRALSGLQFLKKGL